MELPQKVDKKVVMLGNLSIGKTCLVRRYMESKYYNETSNTIAYSLCTKEWKGKSISLWDTAGQEMFSALINSYCRSAHAVILCYDVSDEKSFCDLEERHIKLLKNVSKNCVIVIAGTKVDLISDGSSSDSGKQRVASTHDVEELAQKFSAMFDSLKHPDGIRPVFETSAKENINVTELFEYVFTVLVGESGDDEDDGNTLDVVKLKVKNKSKRFSKCVCNN